LRHYSLSNHLADELRSVPAHSHALDQTNSHCLSLNLIMRSVQCIVSYILPGDNVGGFRKGKLRQLDETNGAIRILNLFIQSMGCMMSFIFRVGQNRIYTPYMTVCMVISLPKMPYIHRNTYKCMVLANSIHFAWTNGSKIEKQRGKRPTALPCAWLCHVLGFFISLEQETLRWLKLPLKQKGTWWLYLHAAGAKTCTTLTLTFITSSPAVQYITKTNQFITSPPAVQYITKTNQFITSPPAVQYMTKTNQFITSSPAV